MDGKRSGRICMRGKELMKRKGEGDKEWGVGGGKEKEKIGIFVSNLLLLLNKLCIIRW